MKVVQLISSGGLYGAESMLLNLCVSQERAARLDDAEGGWRSLLLLFCNLRRPNLELCRIARERGLQVQMVRCRGRVDWQAVGEIRNCIRRESADLVHTHGYKADLYGYLAARREGKPVVATCHNWVGGTAALGIYNRLDRRVLRKFNAIAAVSDRVAHGLMSSGIAANRIRTIANGIDPERFRGAKTAPIPGIQASQELVLGMVARLDLQKGFEYLLGAVRELCGSFPGIRVMVVGEGPDREAVEGMVSGYGLQSHITLTGRRNDLPEIYAAMDVFVLPSLNEGLPMAILEAMAAARPVVATRIGAVPSVVRDGETGLLVEPRDAAGLARAIATLLSDADLRRRLGAQARDWVEKHCTSEAMARNYRQMYEEVLNRIKSESAPKARLLGARDARAGSP